MGAPFEPQRYEAVLAACALLPDLAILPAGDDTEIGEKGVNLSGGQRHRVALARACYADADVYLLDDPLSAVDAHVGRHLFNKCLLGLLGSTTRVLVTHQLQYLPAADVILVIRDGRIVDRGSYEELVSRGVDFHQFELEEDAEEATEGPGETLQAAGSGNGGMNSPVGSPTAHLNGRTGALNVAVEVFHAAAGTAENGTEETLEDIPLIESTHASSIAPVELHASDDATSKAGIAAETGVIEPPLSAPDTPPKRGKAGDAPARLKATPSHRLTKAEERAVGQVDKKIYLRYFASWGPAMLVPGFVLWLCVSERGLQAAQNWWLSVWSEATAAAEAQQVDPGEPLGEHSTQHYMNIYFAMGLVSLALQVTKAVTLVLGSITAARRLQASLLATVLRLPMSFFDSQPTGRLLNRFTKDTEAVDTSLQSSVSSFLNCAVR